MVGQRSRKVKRPEKNIAPLLFRPSISQTTSTFVAGEEAFEAFRVQVRVCELEAFGVARLDGRVGQDVADALQVVHEEVASRAFKGEMRECLRG